MSVARRTPSRMGTMTSLSTRTSDARALSLVSISTGFEMIRKRELVRPRRVREVALHGPGRDLVMERDEGDVGGGEGGGLARDGFALRRVDRAEGALDQRVELRI